MSIRATRLPALLAAVLAAPLAGASPTSLYIMPVADILKHREAFAYFCVNGYERRVFKGYDYSNAVTVGLFNRVEVGYDSDFMGTWSANVKVQLVETKGHALSAGVTNWRGDACDPYVVGRLDGKGYRLHGGYWRTGGSDRLMVGTDFPVGRDFTGSVEFLSGTGSQGWAGLYYAVPQVPGLGLMGALGVSSDHSVGFQHSAVLYYQFKI